jgi:hypothetical protein
MDPTLPDNAIYIPSSSSCTPQGCPAGSIATINNECIAADAGKLCLLKGAAAADSDQSGSDSSSSAGSTSKNRCANAGSTAAAGATRNASLGGAILELISSEISSSGCSPDVSELSDWLQGKHTYMGFNFTEIAGPSSNNEQASGVQWQVIGSLEGSNLGAWRICGLAHGGPGPQPGLTLTGTALSKFSKD